MRPLERRCESCGAEVGATRRSDKREVSRAISATNAECRNRRGLLRVTVFWNSANSWGWTA
eukprot:9493930-Pyramimonas_sp.AAC.1